MAHPNFGYPVGFKNAITDGLWNSGERVSVHRIMKTQSPCLTTFGKIGPSLLVR